jgi:heme A synthase
MVLAAAEKLMGGSMFSDAIRLHGLVPDKFVQTGAMAVIAIEFLVGIACLWSGLSACYMRSSAGLTAFVFASLACYCWALVAYPPKHPAPCGCNASGVLIENWVPLAWRNTGLLLAAVLLGLLVHRFNGKQGTSPDGGVAPTSSH